MTPSLVSEKGRATWDDYAFRKIKHADPTKLYENSWCLLYSYDDEARANKCFDMMKGACSSFDICVETPEWIEVDSSDSR
jgi:hypothetical protein